MAKGLKFIAEKAGVSISTVSHVLNGTASISKEVQDRVLHFARESGYLEKRRQKATISTISSIVLAAPQERLTQNEPNLVVWTVINSLRDECRRRGIRVNPFAFDAEQFDDVDIGGLVSDAGASGLIIINSNSPELLQPLRSTGVKTVLIGRSDPEMQFDSVMTANRPSARYGTNWLINQGHRTIRHVTWRDDPIAQQRQDGYFDAIRDAGLPVPDEPVIRISGRRRELAQSEMLDYLNKKGGIGEATAFFCSADDIAFGLIEAFDAYGINVPEDVSVLGFDGVLPGEFSNPPLTTIESPLAQIGLSALYLLESSLLEPEGQRPARFVELAARIVSRESVRPVK